MKDQKIGFQYILVCFAAVVFSWLFHEFAHWTTSELLGYDAAMTLNRVYPLDGLYQNQVYKVVISSAGPLITFFQASVIYHFLRSRDWRKEFYPFLFTAFYMRFLAGFMNFINPNDEGRISNYFDLGTFTIPFIRVSLLFFMVYRVSKQYRLSWKFQAWTTFFVMIVSSVLILADQFFMIRLL